MATVTPNFNWPVPTSTDLVKDGATAIEALGDSIDASLVDLKGGTTGQVLSKTSNTDMDFTWVAADDTNAIQNTIVDAKGDLIAASAADTPARLAVGNNGETLVADSSTATGLRYQPSISQNFVVNGNFDFWQRGTSFANPSSYTADRWTSGGGSNATVSQETSVVQDGSTYSLKITGTGASNFQNIATYLESSMVNALAGKTIVLSAYVRANATFSGTLLVQISSGTLADTTGGTWTALASQTVTPTTSGWTRVQTSYTIPSGTKGLRFELNYSTVQANGAIVYWSQAQAEIGSVPTQFKRAGGTIQGELAACQRYYYRFKSDTANIYVGNGIAFSTTVAYVGIQFPVTMRTRPTALEQTGTAANYATVRANSSVDNCTAVPVYASTTTNQMGWVNLTSANLVSGNTTSIYTQTADAYLGWSAEL